MAAALVVLAACSSAPKILSWPSPIPTDSGPPTDAAFSVTAGGRISCQVPLGCDGLAWLEPVPAGASSPTLAISPSQQITFASLPTTVLGTWDVAAMPVGAPTRIPAGQYKVAGEVNTISDVLPVVSTPLPVNRVPGCLGDLTVVPDTSVTISVTFAAAGGCTISTTAVPEVHLPSPRPIGVVPDHWMTVSVSNGTTIDVAVFVNGVFVTYMAAGGCVGCHGADGIPASMLPALPWQVDVRTPAGRVLVSALIRAGDVAYEIDGSGGPGGRVDLSCGRIDVWSGPPMLGPAPEPGTPGDCRP